MPYTTLISALDLHRHLNDPAWAIVDCRFSLGDTGRGRRDYERSHIPGAVYAHLDEDLSGPVTQGQTGRHPLPAVETFAQTLSTWGIDSRVQVVAYDDLGGGIAARLWWMLRWLGHEAVAVLDGGWPAWQQAGYPTGAGLASRRSRVFKPEPRPELRVDATDLLTLLDDPAVCVVDARSADRYRGENETIDPVAGRIAGAISAPYADNLGPDGRFLPPEELRARYQTLLGEAPPAQAVLYCGSGVTAAHNLLAMVHAGFPEARLYPGSWSEWITDPERPRATG